MSKDNDAFFNARRVSASHVYSGISFSVGSSSDWIPDLIEIVVAESGDLTLRLIELEAKESEALISSRKYLPENPEKITSAFQEYIGKAIRDCRSRADSREDEFVRLETILSKAEKIFVTSAGALRSLSDFVEELPLIDQPNGLTRTQSAEKILHEEVRNFSGTLPLSGDQAANLGRAILILDAVIRQCDHSDATFKAWRQSDRTQPLKKLLKNTKTVYPHLQAFISEKGYSGITLDFEKIVLELVVIWSKSGNSEMNQESARSLISRYFPIATKITGNDRMPAIFERARRFLTDPC
jgi:hypothetical protein